MFNRRYAYIYDKIGRIQEARNSQSGRSETFAFDPAHNILSDKAAVGKGGNLVSGNRLKEYNGIEYTYDALGNLIYRQLPDGENQYYQYDLENQLVRAEIKKPAGNTEIWTYAYDPFGRRLSKERQDKLAWMSTEPKRTHFVWDGSRLLQEYTYKGSYTYIYTDQDSYEPLAQVFDNAKDGKQYLAYFHNDQIGIPREMTDIHGNLLWYGEYTAWGRLKKDERVYRNAHQPFRLQNQYFDEETGLHYNLMRYYEPEAGRFVNQDPIGLWGGGNLYQFAPNAQTWVDALGLSKALWGRGGFDSWFDSASIADVRKAMADPNSRDAIKGALRNGGGAHEWFPVSMATKAKELGFTASELKELTTPTSDVWFKDIPDPKNPGEFLEGPHSAGKTLPKGQSSRASSIAHDMLGDKLEGAKTKRGAIQRIRNFAERYTRGGQDSVGGCGQVKRKRKK